MPLNETENREKLNSCNVELADFFINFKQEHVSLIQKYYNKSYSKTKADDEKTIKNILGDYRNFITILNEARLLQTAYQEQKLPEIEKEYFEKYSQFLEIINQVTDERHMDVFFHNINMGCRTIFWLSVSISLYSSLFLVALPMISILLPVGIAMGIAIMGTLVASIAEMLDNIFSMKSSKRHSDAHISKQALLNFFKPEPKPAAANNESSTNEPTKTDTDNVPTAKAI